MPRLVKPSLRYKKSFIESYREFQKSPSETAPIFTSSWKAAAGNNTQLNIRNLNRYLGALIKQHQGEADGTKVGKGYVPATLFWLVDGNRWVGRVHIRHKLNSFLRKKGGHIGYYIRPSDRGKGYGTLALSKGLAKARSLGLRKLLVTADDWNTPSWKIIERCGGKLNNIVKTKNERIRRYWIKLN